MGFSLQLCTVGLNPKIIRFLGSHTSHCFWRKILKWYFNTWPNHKNYFLEYFSNIQSSDHVQITIVLCYIWNMSNVLLYITYFSKNNYLSATSKSWQNLCWYLFKFSILVLDLRIEIQIVIFCTAQNLMRKKNLWFFFQCEMNEKIYTSNTHFHVKISLLFTTKMERWPRYTIFHRIWKKHFCNFRNCSSFIKLDK